MDVKANQHQIRQAGKNFYDIDTAKISTLIRPQGEKSHLCYWPLTVLLWMLPTKLGLPKMSPVD